MHKMELSKIRWVVSKIKVIYKIRSNVHYLDESII